MNNGQLHDDKLFRELHDRLSDYEAPYNGADWDAMSKSLDNLPKTKTFRFKFSLNTIGLILGIVGITTAGIIIASNKGEKGTAQETTVPVIHTPSQERPASQVMVASEVQDDNASANTQQAVSTADISKQTPASGLPSVTELRFGDQIDPAKGFVYETSEDDKLIKQHADVTPPDVYYDNDNGKIRAIVIPHDSVKPSGLELQKDSTGNTRKPETAAPTEGQRAGFGDTDGNH